MYSFVLQHTHMIQCQERHRLEVLQSFTEVCLHGYHGSIHPNICPKLVQMSFFVVCTCLPW